MQDCKAVLKNELQKRMGLNAAYSLRAFARDLNMSPSALSEVLKGKKGLSESMAHKISVRLNLTNEEQKHFALLAASQYSRQRQRRASALSEVRAKSACSLKTFAKVNTWYHMALLELIAITPPPHSINKFAKRLDLKPNVVEQALEDLLSVDWIKRSKNSYSVCEPDTTTPFDVPSSAIKDFHASVLKRADQALYLEPVESREYISATMSFPTDQIEKAKSMIRKFQIEFEKAFQGSNRDSIYQLSVQFFRLDKEK